MIRRSSDSPKFPIITATKYLRPKRPLRFTGLGATNTVLATPTSRKCGVFLAACLFVLTVSNMLLLRASENILPIKQGISLVEPSNAASGSNSNRNLQSLETKRAGRQITWLMSFPNSGTSFTSRVVRDATKTVSASNYADETPTGEKGIKEAAFADYPEGPFWIKPEASPDFSEPTKHILTKTHCGIRCTMCPPDKYSETTYSFRRNCFKTKWVQPVDGGGSSTRIFGSYSPERVTQAVHLVRDPFDNIVSRFHLERQLPGRKAASYPKTREGFREYCKAIDSLHAVNEKRAIFLDEALLEIMKEVPCHEDFLRYIEWHNLAFVTTRDLELDTYVLHYDWYLTRHQAVAQELLNFLELPMHPNGELTPFVAGKVYPYFTADEKRALKRGFEIMSAPKTWEHVKHYFDDVEQNTFIANVTEAAIEDSQSPQLNALVSDGSETEIHGDVQYLMDFAIVGYPKTATSNLVRWLSQHEDVSMHPNEIYHLKDGQPANMVRKLFALPDGIRGYKAPRDVHNPRAVRAFARYWPRTKLIVGLRHPVLWFESFYNYRIRGGVTLPPTSQLIGNCPPKAHNVCTEEIRYHDHLARLGKTARTDPEELALLSPVLPRHRNLPHLTNNPIFLYEISEMNDPTPEFRSRLQEYLGLPHQLGPLQEAKEARGERKDGEIDICDEVHREVHADLMDVARRSAQWILGFLLKAEGVEVADRDQFSALLEAWKSDPCAKRRLEQWA